MIISNNARKRKHMVKITRHWKVVLPIKISNEVLKRAFGSTNELNKLIDYIIEDTRALLSMYNWCDAEEVIYDK